MQEGSYANVSPIRFDIPAVTEFLPFWHTALQPAPISRSDLVQS